MPLGVVADTVIALLPLTLGKVTFRQPYPLSTNGFGQNGGGLSTAVVVRLY